ncbi:MULTISPECIES: tetratricopeptide repeat protein [Marinobacter]|uniref:Tetratricopeptide repeat protein n=1 Tax=Marinobacter xiaoshiensis TaxID=3073652 RepID=A0ABU2HHH1_9GAMM|nr:MULTISPECIES: tetratricopeptide repeat protein [unclassified Marinobacter]MDS1309765.1 tetratricopeptide repeat protein [Marinobacter sp. F60267]
MIWVKKLNPALMLLLLLTGCAVGPERTTALDDAAVTAESEARLQEAFSEAVVLMENGDLEEARSRFEKMTAEHPERSGPIANLGLLAMQSGDMELARVRFEQVLALNPKHPVANNHLGVIARNAGDFSLAEKRYREALAANPEYLPALLNLAFLLDIYLGQPAQALPLYEQYKERAEEPDPRVKDWIFDAKNRI